MLRAAYRARQFFGALLGGVSKQEMTEARRVLGPDLFSLFALLPKQYRRHGITVYNRVKEAGCGDSGVLQAALLHDCGKYDPWSGRYVMLGHRVAVVLLEALPGGRSLMDNLAERGNRHTSRRKDPILYPFYLHLHHPTLGARIVAIHGGSDDLLKLIIAHHLRGTNDSQLETLQAADDRS